VNKRVFIGNRLALLLSLLILLLSLTFFINNSKPTIVTESEIIARFIQIYHSRNIHNRTLWLGVPTQENPCDMWAMQEIITETKPDIIIETGTFKGGGAIFYASVIQNVKEQSKVITVDIKPQFGEAAKTKIFKERVEFIEGSSVSAEVINKIRDRVQGLRVMVTLDSDHHMEHVLKELRLYSSFVSRGCYLIVQDTSHNGHPLRTTYGRGPWEALQEFMEDNKTFEVDKSRGKFLLTFHPQGYLRRVR
jgi:cephalosporin hydroxylase